MSLIPIGTQCNRTYRKRDGQWTQCKRRAIASVPSRNIAGVWLCYCARHAPED